MSSAGAPAPGEAIDVALSNGVTVHIRPVVVEDLDAVGAFLASLSSEAVGLRFFGAVDLGWAAALSVDVSDFDRYGLVATLGPEQRIVAHGGYIRDGAHRAEVAFVVADALHHLGLATTLLRRLAAVARSHGISRFIAVVLPHNQQMIDVFRDSGFPVELTPRDGVIGVELATSPDVVSVEPRLGGGWAVTLRDHPAPISQHDTEEEAQHKAEAYRRGLDAEQSS